VAGNEAGTGSLLTAGKAQPDDHQWEQTGGYHQGIEEEHISGCLWPVIDRRTFPLSDLPPTAWLLWRPPDLRPDGGLGPDKPASGSGAIDPERPIKRSSQEGSFYFQEYTFIFSFWTSRSFIRRSEEAIRKYCSRIPRNAGGH
jgi:hypothetical protein